MRSLNFKEYFEEQFLPNIGKSAADFAADSLGAQRMVNYINMALATAWRNAFWPDGVTLTEERALDSDGVLPRTESGVIDAAVDSEMDVSSSYIVISGPMDARLPFVGMRNGKPEFGYNLLDDPYYEVRVYYSSTAQAWVYETAEESGLPAQILISTGIFNFTTSYLPLYSGWLEGGPEGDPSSLRVTWFSGLQEIDAVASIHATEADAKNKIKGLGWEQTPAGWRVYDGVASDTVWVRYRPYPPRFTRVSWDESAGYSIGSRVYSTTSGNCFRSLTEHTGEDPDSDDGTNWVQEVFPELFADYVTVRGSVGHYNHESKFDVAGVERAAADKMLFYLKKARGL